MPPSTGLADGNPRPVTAGPVFTGTFENILNLLLVDTVVVDVRLLGLRIDVVPGVRGRASYNLRLRRPNDRAARARPALGLSPGAAGSACAILRYMEIIEAEFENGVLRPTRRLALRPGERVGIVVVRRPDPARWNLARLSKIAAADEEKLAEEGLGDWAAALDREDRH